MLLWLSLAGPAAAATAVTILCDNGYPPYSYEENGEAKGLYNDILRAAFAQMPDYQVEIQPVPWRRGLDALAKGRSFALFPPYYRPAERPYMDYSRPILEERLVVFVRAEVARARSIDIFPEDYVGLRIGINAGFSPVQNPLYHRMLGKGLLTESFAKDNRSNLLKLHRGRIDAYINDRLSILWELGNLQQRGELPGDARELLIEGPTLSVEQGYLGFTNRNPHDFPYKEDFIRQLNAALDSLEQAGAIQQTVMYYQSPAVD
ncbi:transporter substrate-binding domain-containing protein [Pseudomonas sp. CAU 1711]|uniref:substrate-binding periplasmic protein n=1 Tax=Pseudomonas sp. CAU 1711 TaxID=3140356 RepID=UPI003260DE97